MGKLHKRVSNFPLKSLIFLLGRSPKNFNASAVNSTFSIVKDPYPNNPLIIWSDAMSKPKLAGIDNSKDNSIDLLWILETLEKFFTLNAFDSTGSDTVPTAIPAIAKLIW